MSVREIVTFQIGHYANFVGTHWWNIQESSFIYDPKLLTEPKEINPDVLFREGRNLLGEVTFTPRLVSLDLKGSLNTLKPDGTLYDIQSEEDVKWNEDITLHKGSSVYKNQFLLDLEDEEKNYMTRAGGSNSGSLDEDEKMDDAAELPGGSTQVKDQIFGPCFYDLDNVVNVWSDFLRIHFHPKSVNIIEEFSHCNEILPFDIFGCGQQILTKRETWTEIEDRIHYFTEECDQLQGFHILMDTYDAFGGLGSFILEYLEDDFPNKAFLTFGTSPAVFSYFTQQDRNRIMLNSALSLYKTASHSSLYVPLCLASEMWPSVGQPITFPQLTYKVAPLLNQSVHMAFLVNKCGKFQVLTTSGRTSNIQAHLNYHSSAILAASLDTCTLPYRLQTHPTHLTDITHSFHALGRKIATLVTALPFPLSSDSTLVESLMYLKGKKPWVPVTPHMNIDSHPFIQSSALRGISASNITRKGINASNLLRRCMTASEVLELYITDMYPTSLNAGTFVKEPCKVTPPFPHMFRKNIDKNGLSSDRVRPPNHGVDSVPMMTSLQSSPSAGVYLQRLHTESKKINIHKQHRFIETGLEVDEYKEILDELENMSQGYSR